MRKEKPIITQTEDLDVEDGSQFSIFEKKNRKKDIMGNKKMNDKEYL